jgi:hypothetical protein
MPSAEAVEKQPTKPTEKRGDGCDPHFAKAEKEMALGRQKRRMETAEREQEDARFVKLVRMGFGSMFEGTVKNHPAYSPADLVLFRKRGFKV